MNRDARPLGRNRWLFLNNADHGDHLVHSVMAVYNPTFEEFDGRLLPMIGISECGIYIKTLTGESGRAAQGVFINDDHFPTCIRCASGVCTDGISFRQVGKQAAFGRLYGQSLNYPVQSSTASMSRPNMQQMPRHVSGHRAHDVVLDEAQQYSLKELSALLAPWLKASKPP